MSQPATALAEKLGHTFGDISLLETALVHASYSNDQRAKEIACNERLEFLGDSVLNLLAGEYLYGKLSHRAEGDLTKVRAAAVCEDACYEIAKTLDLGQYLLLGKGEEQSGGRNRVSILADAMEAVIAALYLDGGLDCARQFLLPHLEARVDAVLQTHFLKNYKTALQEIVQKNKQETLRYALTGQEGPDHAKTFTVTLYLNANPIAQGVGHSKKEAEQAAAKAALILMGEPV